MAMAAQDSGINSLPNELILQILSTFTTRSLLNFATISQRIHCLVLRLIHTRLLAAATIKSHKLILECFHPSAKWSTPGLPCIYLGTDNLLIEDLLPTSTDTTGRLSLLAGLYSHFRPQEAEQPRRTRRPHPAGDVPGHPNTSTSQDHFDTPQIPSQDIHLDSYERFSQLCTIANLVKVGPRAGLYLSCVTIGDGVIRVFRDWLREHAVVGGNLGPIQVPADFEERMLWLDTGKNVGVRLRVTEMEELGGAVLLGAGEDPNVSYTLEYEELVIRTTQLLLKTEESLLQESDLSGKAMIIGAWRD